MASNAAKKAKLSMTGSGSQSLANDENAPNKEEFWSHKTTSRVAANCCAPPSSIGTELPDLKILGICFGVYIGVGTMCFYAITEDLNGRKTLGLIDALYMCVVSMTTVGYGDLVPTNYSAQLVCCAVVTVGMCLVGVAVKIASQYLVVKQQMVMVNALHMARKMGPIEALAEIESLKIDYKKCLISLYVMAGHFVIGVIGLLVIEELNFSDSIYCVITTMTTVGFGDESFQTGFGRMFAAIWITTGTSSVGQLFLYIAEVFTDIETRKLVKQVITTNIVAKRHVKAVDNVQDDKVYGAADFILYKLKEMGKIKQEDISFAMKDVDGLIKDVDVDDQKVTHVRQAQSSQNN